MNFETGLIHIRSFVEQFESTDSLYNVGYMLDQIHQNEIENFKTIFDHVDDPDSTAIHLRNVLDITGYDKIKNVLHLLKGKSKGSDLLMFLRNTLIQIDSPSINDISENSESLTDIFFLFVGKILEKVEDKNKTFAHLLSATKTLHDDNLVLQLSLTQDDIPNFEIFVERLSTAVKTTKNVNWIDAVSIGQIRSKKWLLQTIKTLNLDLGKTCILGGWIGTLSYMLGELNLNITSIDIDDDCVMAAKILNPNNFESKTADMFELDLSQYDTIINTSTEHIDYPNWHRNLPKGKTVIVQNNNRSDYEGHICCYSNVKSFVTASDYEEILFSGTLDVTEYNRAMIIAKT